MLSRCRLRAVCVAGRTRMGVLERLVSVQDLVVLQTSTPEFADILQYKDEDWQAVDKVSLVSCMPEGLKENYKQGAKKGTQTNSEKSKRKRSKSAKSKNKNKDNAKQQSGPGTESH